FYRETGHLPAAIPGELDLSSDRPPPSWGIVGELTVVSAVFQPVAVIPTIGDHHRGRRLPRFHGGHLWVGNRLTPAHQTVVVIGIHRARQHQQCVTGGVVRQCGRPPIRRRSGISEIPPHTLVSGNGLSARDVSWRGW